MTRVRDFRNYLRNNIEWDDEAYIIEAEELYAAAIREAAYGWFPRSFRAWLSWFIGAMFIGALLMATAMMVVAWATGGLR